MSDKYKCVKCGRWGVKLWRVGGSCHYFDFTCHTCTVKEAQEKKQPVYSQTEIGDRVPAIPSSSDSTIMCSVTATPKDAFDRWNTMPQ